MILLSKGAFHESLLGGLGRNKPCDKVTQSCVDDMIRATTTGGTGEAAGRAGAAGHHNGGRAGKD